MTSDKRSYQKNVTMHSEFQLRNLTKISEFNERTNNYLKNNNNKKQQQQQKVDRKDN